MGMGNLLKGGISKRGNYQNGESPKGGITKMGHLQKGEFTKTKKKTACICK